MITKSLIYGKLSSLKPSIAYMDSNKLFQDINNNNNNNNFGHREEPTWIECLFDLPSIQSPQDKGMKEKIYSPLSRVDTQDINHMDVNFIIDTFGSQSFCIIVTLGFNSQHNWGKGHVTN